MIAWRELDPRAGGGNSGPADFKPLEKTYGVPWVVLKHLASRGLHVLMRIAPCGFAVYINFVFLTVAMFYTSVDTTQHADASSNLYCFNGVCNGKSKGGLLMASPLPATETLELFPYTRWSEPLPALARRYREAKPFPHTHLTEFLEPQTAHSLANEFPASSSSAWIQYKHYNENKAGLTKRELFPATMGKVVDELNSPKFLAWLSELTGIPDLMSDPTLEGGGLHQSARGGFLNLHADFTMHHHHSTWRRRLNLILYLNPDWQPEWGGGIELWDDQMRQCAASVPPLLNHALIFSTTETSYHGFPEKLACPEHVSRKSLALYYYTIEQNSHYAGRSTNYQSRPEDAKSKAALIWLDKKAVHVYSKTKAKLGIGDDLASKVLGFLSRKK